MRFHIRTLFVAIAIFGAIYWIVIQSIPVQGVNATRQDVPLDWKASLREIPDGATNVSFYYGGIRNPNTYYEFEMDEPKFYSWINSLPRFSGGPSSDFYTYRFNHNKGVVELFQITSGASYHWANPNDGDHGEHLAYDDSSQMAYYQHHTF